jgi:2-iminobutanoate/2-iminopropanoate deaminase
MDDPAGENVSLPRADALSTLEISYPGARFMAEFFNPPAIWQPFGPFSMAAVEGEGRIVHLKGQVALNPAGKVVGPGDMRVQLTQVLENIRGVLAAFGGEIGDIVSMTQYTTDLDDFMAAGDLRRAVFKPPYPVTTTVEVIALYDPALMIEIAAIAEIPKERFKRPA